MICKVKPEKRICKSCLEVQVMCNVVETCKQCLDNKPYCTLLHLEGDYAHVLNDGKIEKVSLDRIYDVKE